MYQALFLHLNVSQAIKSFGKEQSTNHLLLIQDLDPNNKHFNKKHKKWLHVILLYQFTKPVLNVMQLRFTSNMHQNCRFPIAVGTHRQDHLACITRQSMLSMLCPTTGNLKMRKHGNRNRNGNGNNQKMWWTWASLATVLSLRVSNKPELAPHWVGTFFNR